MTQLLAIAYADLGKAASVALTLLAVFCLLQLAIRGLGGNPMTTQSIWLSLLGATAITLSLMILPALGEDQVYGCCPAPGAEPAGPAAPATRPTRPLPELYIDRIKLLEGWRSCEKNGINGYSTKAEVPGECIPKIVGNERLYDELLEAARQVDLVNADLPIGTRAALTSLTHSIGTRWADSYLGRYVREGRWDLARELFVAYVGDGSAAEQAAALKRRRIELSWFGHEGPSTTPAPRRPAPRPQQPQSPRWN